LKDKGYKLTPQRKAIISIISKDKSHPSTSDIISKTRQKYPNISVSTIYYTISLLKREGLIREIEFYDMDNRYDNNLNDHINLICEGCGKIEDYEIELSVSKDKVLKDRGFQTLNTRYEYYGYCNECLKKKK
ncbi:MAG: transcriptional repressor, partial [Thermodesulfovibrionales bacterium]|nr:transcriptional repressor [Thermodesulfovibrionales bacterium]